MLVYQGQRNSLRTSAKLYDSDLTSIRHQNLTAVSPKKSMMHKDQLICFLVDDMVRILSVKCSTKCNDSDLLPPFLFVQYC